MGKYVLAIAMVCTLTNAPAAFAECFRGSGGGLVLLNTADPGYPEYINSYCFVPFQAGMNTVTVRMWAIPFQKVRFSIPDPSYGTVVSENWFFPHTGNWATGVELDLGSCSTGEFVTLGEIQVHFESDPPASCPAAESTWQANSAEIQNCSGNWMGASGFWHSVGPAAYGPCCAGWQFLYSLPPHSLKPADGATNVPLNTTLRWVGGSTYTCYVDIFTEPTCTTGQTFPGNCEYGGLIPELLMPNTTYYWRVWYPGDPSGWGGGGSTYVHSFTTSDVILPTEQSTWGRVKAMYRN